jgi:hypothetical protein
MLPEIARAPIVFVNQEAKYKAYDLPVMFGMPIWSGNPQTGMQVPSTRN